jgi:hypothetical protein
VLRKAFLNAFTRSRIAAVEYMYSGVPNRAASRSSEVCSQHSDREEFFLLVV